MWGSGDMPALKDATVQFTKMMYAASVSLLEIHSLRGDNFGLDVYMDEVRRRLVTEITYHLAGDHKTREQHSVVQYPENWWQAFKIEVLETRRFGRWLMRRLRLAKGRRLAVPTKEVFNDYKLCPHLPLTKTTGWIAPHVRYMIDPRPDDREEHRKAKDILRLMSVIRELTGKTPEELRPDLFR